MDRNTTAVVQARMGSVRLPGKVLMEIEGSPILWHVVNRLKRSRLIRKIVVATTKDIKDNMIEDYCIKQDIDFYRGSEKDVLDRYYQAASIYQADPVVRITADCPMIDPDIVDKVISGYLADIDNLKGSSNTVKRTYPRGLDTEVISFSALEQIWNSADKG